MHHLAYTTDGAAANMATDQWLLENYPEPGVPRFRHYGWTEPAYTFGFAQAWGPELEALAKKHAVIRRETGGGLVDHNRDWTWTVILPLEHPAAEGGLTCLYSGLHRALHEALIAQDAPVFMQSTAPAPLSPGAFRQCFTRAERDDVVLADGRKVAGAAQRRTRAGILAQGYVDRPTLPDIDWVRLETDFAATLARWLDSPSEKISLPSPNTQAYRKAVQRFASPEWNHHRKRK